MPTSDSDHSQISSVDIIPLAPTDQLQPVPNLRTRTFFILDEALDEDLLQKSLNTLIRHHWRKLGARIHKRPQDGMMEWHLPKSFDQKYSLFKWTSKEYGHSIEETGLPKSTPPEKGLALHPAPDVFDKWFRPSDWPFELSDDEPDLPLLLVHITHFSDPSTVIAISFPHAIGDQYGLSNVMKAWLGLMKGEIPPPMFGFDQDPLPGKAFTEWKKEEIRQKGRLKVKRRGEFTVIFACVIPELIMKPKEYNHSLFIPTVVVETLKARMIKSLKEKNGTDPGLTNGDVLTSILTKFSQIYKSSKRHISMSQTVNLRNRVPKLQGDTSETFIHNGLHYATARYKLSPTTPLSEIAYQNRLAVKQAMQPQDIEKGVTVIREMVRRKQSIVICEPFERFYHITNWSSMWRDLDFTPAVKGREEGVSRRPTLMVLGESRASGRDLRRWSTTIMCKTEYGYWCNFALPEKGMKILEDYLKKDPMLEHL